MKTKAVRLYGKEDLRLEEFELPEIREDEILARVVSDSVCMSSYKAAEQGSAHKRVPDNISTHPVIIGHEFCGELIQVGARWKNRFVPGSRFSIQPAMNLPSDPYAAPGYSYEYIGGAAQYIIIPNEVMESGCLLPYNGDAFFYGSLSEPMSCIVGAFHANYHTSGGSYVHTMGIRRGGNMAILAGVGPMGLGAIDYAIHTDLKPGLIVVTDIDDARLQRAQSLLTPEEAERNGVRLVYINTAKEADPVARLLSMTDGKGYDDVFVFAPVKPVVEQGDAILGRDGCLNFFAGPLDPAFSAMFNFYNVHYASTHVVGTSGGNTDDMLESIRMMENGQVNPAGMITHVGGLDSVVETTLNLPKIPGGKKLIYTGISMPLTAIADMEQLGGKDPLMAELAEITKAASGLWCAEAEKLLLSRAVKI
ncbi:MAG TPA: L-sorbose 1-phosphate reductase [Clostridiales bacterium]|nr:L-sorbose 1-phosphate reductase [Clostridiales bacterium]